MNNLRNLLSQLAKPIVSSPLWYLVPSLAVVAAIGVTIACYEPLTFDPSLYAAQPALAVEPQPKEADETKRDEESKKNSVGTDDPANGRRLNDGSWTGYAVCGEGNVQGWQPYYVAVTIEVRDGKVSTIASIEGSATGGEGSAPLAWNPAESGRFLDLAIAGHNGDGVKPQMDQQVSQTGAVSSIDTVSGATYSSAAIYNAYADAVARAGGAPAQSATAQVATSESLPSAQVPAVVAPTSQSATYADGDWTAYAACGHGNADGWSPYYVGVTVRVAGGRPTGITNIWGSATGDVGNPTLAWNAAESSRYLDWATNGRNAQDGVKGQVNGQLASGGSVVGVDTVSGATYSSSAIVEAYGLALAKSAQAAGTAAVNTPAAPKPSKPAKPGKEEPEQEEPQKVDPDDEEEVRDADFADGSWTGYAACGKNNEDGWSPYYVAVTLTVKDGKVESVDEIKGSAKANKGDPKLGWDASESQRYLDWAMAGRTRNGTVYQGVLDQARAAIKVGASLGSVDVVSGATFSSKAIVKAYYAALQKAAAAAGKAYEEPEADDGKKTDDEQGKDDDSEEGKKDDQRDADSHGDDATDSGNTEGSSDPSHQDDEEEVLVDGEYTGHGWCEDPNYEDDWDPYYVLVSIRVQGGSVTKVTQIRGDSEGEVDPNWKFNLYNATYLNWAIGGTARASGVMQQLQAKIDAGEKVGGIDVVSGATFSSKAIMDGYSNAVAQARQEADTSGGTNDSVQ